MLPATIILQLNPEEAEAIKRLLQRKAEELLSLPVTDARSLESMVIIDIALQMIPLSEEAEQLGRLRSYLASTNPNKEKAAKEDVIGSTEFYLVKRIVDADLVLGLVKILAGKLQLPLDEVVSMVYNELSK